MWRTFLAPRSSECGVVGTRTIACSSIFSDCAASSVCFVRVVAASEVLALASAARGSKFGKHTLRLLWHVFRSFCLVPLLECVGTLDSVIFSGPSVLHSRQIGCSPDVRPGCSCAERLCVKSSYTKHSFSHQQKVTFHRWCKRNRVVMRGKDESGCGHVGYHNEIPRCFVCLLCLTTTPVHARWLSSHRPSPEQNKFYPNQVLPRNCVSSPPTTTDAPVRAFVSALVVRKYQTTNDSPNTFSRQIQCADHMFIRGSPVWSHREPGVHMSSTSNHKRILRGKEREIPNPC